MHARKMISVPQLKERGWTQTMINKILVNHDDTKPNPHYRSAAPMKLYDTARVKRSERTKTFKLSIQRANQRRTSIQPVIDAKRDATLARARTFPINIKVLPMDKLRQNAENSWLASKYERDEFFSGLNDQPSDEFYQRICVNYIRHEMTPYDTALYKQFKAIGKSEAVLIIQKRVFAEIKRAYPALADECDRQMSARWL